MPLQTDVVHTLRQRLVADACARSGVGDIFAVGDLRIGICLEHVGPAFTIKAQVDARTAVDAEDAADASGLMLELFHHRVG